MRYASVCDGIGAVHAAWQPLGWECAWTSEIEPFPAAVVDHHWKLKNLGDMTKLTEEMLDECGPISLLCGGTPCQSFSVAGLRKGLEDPRGNLALRFTQLVGVLRPEWVVWENVPGVLSSGNGRDFGTFLGALAELGYGFAYRILDAQWFGVAQRRRRVFVVANAGDWRRAAAVLFERESLFGNPPTREAKRERITGPIAGCSNGGGANGPGRTADDADSLVPVGFKENMSTPDAAVGLGTTLQAENFHAVAFAQNQREEVRELSDCSAALNLQGTHQQTFIATPFTKAKRAQSETDDESWVPGDVAPTQSCFDQGDVRATTVVACELADTLSVGANQTTGFCGDAVASCEISSSLRSNPGSGWRSNGTPVEGVAIQGMAVRRLTPRECERLQGFPDDYTAIEYRKKPSTDGPRYKALGNSMAVPVMAWIGKRIAEVEATDGTHTK
jgi:DNA (cytosine-5)-methyltransferase 1